MSKSRASRRIMASGIVQGVGFRPYVARLAREWQLSGWVRNLGDAVEIRVQGEEMQLDRFLMQLQEAPPPLAQLDTLQVTSLDLDADSAFMPSQTFAIVESVGSVGSEESGVNERSGVSIAPDRAICGECVQELKNPQAHRFDYPFISCNQCGPRYAVLQSLPYARVSTGWQLFDPCQRCQSEFESDTDRRFHHEGIACHSCGPQLIWRGTGAAAESASEPLDRAVQVLQQGGVIALKSYTGFLLLASTAHPKAIERIRRLKSRPVKPLAVMLPDIRSVQAVCEVSPTEGETLLSPAAPIVLLRKRHWVPQWLQQAAPENPYLGVMLPYTGTLHLLAERINQALVATSANRAGEPIAAEWSAVSNSFGKEIDGCLDHSLPIYQPQDDSLVQCIGNQMMMLRRARGFAPGRFDCPGIQQGGIALGGHMKTSPAVSSNGKIVVGQFCGDLDSLGNIERMRETLTSLTGSLGITPQLAVHDLHPEYGSRHVLKDFSIPKLAVQHHRAHLGAVLLEYPNAAPALALVWDGTGLGEGRQLWGSETIVVESEQTQRVAALKPIPLLGGEQAIKEPARIALAMLQAAMPAPPRSAASVWDSLPLTANQRQNLLKLLQHPGNLLQSSGMGRLFDGVSSLLGLVHESQFDGHAAMQLQYAAEASTDDHCYEFDLNWNGNLWEIDWQPAVLQLLQNLMSQVPVTDIAARFHGGLVKLALRLCKKWKQERLLVTGGCFQNRYLLERLIKAGEQAGVEVLWPQQLPPNDGGLSAGQLYLLSQHSIARV